MKSDGKRATSKSEGKKTTASIERNKRVTFFLRLDMCCCYDYIHKLERFIIQIDGVEYAEGNLSSNKPIIKVIGKVNPLKIREMIELKTKKNVELIFHLPKEEMFGDKNGYKGREEQRKNTASNTTRKLPMNTVFLKIKMDSDDCIEKVQEVLMNIDGIHEINVEPRREMVKVTGTMDVIRLPNYLKQMLRTNVVVIQPKEGSWKWKENGGGSNVEETKEATSNVEHSEYTSLTLTFSDENTNACTIM